MIPAVTVFFILSIDKRGRASGVLTGVGRRDIPTEQEMESKAGKSDD